jgi:hypothetical protein
MRHVRELDPYDADPDEWDAECDRLDQLLQQGDSQAVLRWFLDRYPRCMALVPRRRRASFLKGVRDMALELGITNENMEE